MYSVVIPVYKNEANLDRLLQAMEELSHGMAEELEIVFVVDGSPDRCLAILRERLPHLPVRTQLVSLSRNFGSFAAVAAGMERAEGDYLAVMAADLQEPPELIRQFFEILSGGTADIVFGVRSRRSDPWLSGAASNFFWWVYRRFVIRDMPPGGVDVFACSREVRDRLLQLQEAHTNLIALLFWLGYRREYVVYERLARLEGKSAWSLRKKLRYGFDSVFNFTDLPIQILLCSGATAFILAVFVSLAVLVAKLRGDIPVPGYTPIVLVILFFGSLTSLGFGIIGQYLWLALQNTRRRPNYIVHSEARHDRAGKTTSGRQQH